ncbi:P-loop NTPase fold protein [Mesoplasma florum]|uniref:P-loop NTPase fold protein n=1 Tax=Mesoplasma florum TaxID=2151 RepID=UPI000BE2F913|nr:P-loop NTPase fold protein [Mesoplasma florum]ATI73665.1 hypothetical protein CQZ70_00095 [Mesoplasma florum]
MENKYKDGNCVKLSAKVDDINLVQLSKEFLKDIETNFNNFNKKHKSFVKENKKYLNNEKYIFIPEDLVKRSPLTIINAPWGSGKTFFIESFTKSFIDKQIQSNIFDSIIIIDAWKFSSSNSVPVEFASEISKNIVKLHNVPENIKEGVINKFFKFITPSQISATLSLNLGILSIGLEGNKDINANNKKEQNEINEAFEEFKENQINTIIFVDNLERLGSYSWDLLKCIIKLQEFPNFLIVLPLNLEKMKNNKKESIEQMEYPIQKYIDFNYYNFSQDYYHFLKKGFDGKQSEEIIQKINKILDNDIEGQKLSIREVKASFEKHDIFNIENEYDIYKKIKDFIWDPSTLLNSILIDDINSFKNFHKNKFKIIDDFYCKEIESDYWVESILNPENWDAGGYKTSIFDIVKDGSQNYYDLNSNYISELNAIDKEIKKYKNSLNLILEKMEKEFNLTKENLAKNEKTLLKDKELKDKFQNDYSYYQTKRSDKDFEWSSEEFTLKEKILLNQEKRVKALEEEKTKIEDIIFSFDKSTKKIRENIDELNDFDIKPYVNELKKIEELSEIENYKWNYILNFLNNNFEDLYGWIEDDINVDEMILEKINSFL